VFWAKEQKSGEPGAERKKGEGVRLHHWLALARFLPNVALQVFDRRVAGRVGVSSRSEGEREG
jgi:hypothetical protein